MKRRLAIGFTMSATLLGCSAGEELPVDVDFELPANELAPVGLPTRIGFGSCSDPNYPMDALDVAAQLDPMSTSGSVTTCTPIRLTCK